MGGRHLYPMVLALFVGALCGAGASQLYRIYRCGPYKFINADIACGATRGSGKTAYIKLENDIRSLIDDKVAKGAAVKVSVYFRDLTNGPVFGVNENEDFIPASLLKLPLVVTYFNITERAPGLLEIPLTYRRDKPLFVPPKRQHVPPPEELQPGMSYPIEELMRRTLEYSDNTAYSLLVEYMNTSYPDGTKRVLQTFHELGVIDPRDSSDEVASVRGYASIFRILYNASYLSAENSEKVLSWLIRARFPKGLVAGLPQDVKVADKFGERDLADGSQQVHDCGIVYYPDDPYLLCVMTKGQNWDVLTGIIAQVSRMVYAEVNSRR